MRHHLAHAVVASVATLLSIAVGASASSVPPGSWRQTGVQRFVGADAEIRSQGLAAAPGGGFFFSWQLGLMHTSSDPFAIAAVNPYAIPPDLVIQGSNHIGDIDYYDGKVYAPIEDGDRYLRPYVGVYDAKTMLPTGVRYALPQKLLLEGVPWVAVDPARGQAYTAEWNNTKVLNVHRLSDLDVIRTQPLSIRLGRIQGAKMLDGLLYAAEDNGNQKSIVAIDPDTGVVTPVFDRNLPPGTEAEGLAFTPTAAGPVMHTLEVAPDGLSVNLRSFAREVPPLVTTITPQLVVQATRIAGRHWKTITSSRQNGAGSYYVRVRREGRTLASGTAAHRRLTLTVSDGVSAADRGTIRGAVRHLFTDLRSVTVRTAGH